MIRNIEIKDISANNTLEVFVDGDGNYEYSLDGFMYQESNFFEGIAPGFYTMYVRDSNGCGISEQELSVIGYPKFFTPNGDGINDNWQLIGVNENFQMNSSVSIFDRYGKSLVNLNASTPSWNGTKDSKALPAADYWFKATLEDGREFKGHFSLKK
jgi:gliding motility-associated-like protein